MHRPVGVATVGRPSPTPTYTFLTTPPIGRQGYRSAVVAGVLAILLGSLGVHRFYLGYTGAGAAFLLSSVGGILYAILVVPFFFAMAASVLALVEGILLLTGAFDTDVDGARLQR